MRLGLKDLFGCPHSLTAGLSRGRRVESAALVTIHMDSRSFSPVWGSLEVFEGQCPGYPLARVHGLVAIWVLWRAGVESGVGGSTGL